MSDNFVELWHGELSSESEADQTHWSLLNEDERNKAMAFVRPELQQKFIKVRGVLRIALGTYLRCAPEEIIIKTGAYGKPFVTNELVQFNLSHTKDKFVIVISNCSEVGVDIEQCRNRKGLLGLVEKCFSKEEAYYWNTLTEKQKVDQFFQFWVRKEAFVKAVGRGIALGLNLCSVSPEDKDCFLSLPEGYGLISDWKIVDVPTGYEHACAIVTKNIEFNYTQTKWK